MSIFRENKQKFLDEKFKENSSHRPNYEEAYKNNIEKLEIERNKDLEDFTKDEIQEIIGRKTKSKNGYKTVTESFIFEYLDFAKEMKKIEKRIQRQKEQEKREKIRIQKKKEREERQKIKIQKQEQLKKIKADRIAKMKKYVEQKKVFMKEFHFDKEDVTKKTYMDCYKSAIAPLEVYKGKDLYEFIEDDIIELFESMPTTSINVKRMVRNFINSYFIWTESKGMNLTHHNPLQTLDNDELFELNLKAFRKQFLSIDETYELCEKAIKNGSNYQDCAIVILARNGVNGKALSEILNLREEDINAENKKLRIVDEETGEVRHIDIDIRFLQWIEKAIDCYVYDYKTKNGNNNEKDFYDRGYIIKSQNEDDEKETKDNAYRRISKMCECTGIRPLSTNNLIVSYMFDLLNQIREIKGDDMENSDIEYVYRLCYPNSSKTAYWTLKEKYETYYGILIVGKDLRGRVYNRKNKYDLES
ncbi:hypothetical protein [uncultured Clostridium sp.]|uniref:phage lytic cycle repressor MrpR family protein n=1 Tax=uncultured Clostridium sp. TaxID=59620 RepID=UPI0032175748